MLVWHAGKMAPSARVVALVSCESRVSFCFCFYFILFYFILDGHVLLPFLRTRTSEPLFEDLPLALYLGPQLYPAVSRKRRGSSVEDLRWGRLGTTSVARRAGKEIRTPGSVTRRMAFGDALKHI